MLSWKVKYQETCACDERLKSKYGAFLFSNFETVTPGINLVNRISNLFFSKNRASLAPRRATEGGGGRDNHVNMSIFEAKLI